MVRGFFLLFVSVALCGCGFFPGFGILEDPALYILPVGIVANQVACELQEFMIENKSEPADTLHRWHLADEDVSVRLTLNTDTSGYVDFTGINVAQVGLETLASFISTQSKVSTLAAKVSGKRTRTVTVSFSVSPNPLPSDKNQYLIDPVTHKAITPNCAQNWRANNLVESLYLRDWLTSYFETINTLDKNQRFSPSDNPTDNIARAIRQVAYPDAIPEQFKIQSVEMSTQFLIAADISGGATPNILGNGSVFILPINGLSADYNPDYSDKIDITLNMCDSLQNDSTCNGKKPPTAYYPLLDKQCEIYSHLAPLLTVKPPRDYQDFGKTCSGQCTCSKYKGIYVPKSKTS
jgi:hypothetical protein